MLALHEQPQQVQQAACHLLPLAALAPEACVRRLVSDALAHPAQVSCPQIAVLPHVGCCRLSVTLLAALICCRGLFSNTLQSPHLPRLH